MARRTFGAVTMAGAVLVLTGASAPVSPVSPPAFGPRRSSRPPPPTSAHEGASERPCPEGMRLVEGEYCEDVEQRCLAWLPKLPGAPPRCARFAPSGACKGGTEHLRFCMDAYEYPNRKGELPTVHVTWNEAQALCRARGRRLCKGREWTTACEGPERLPYPYGYARDSEVCNVDRPMYGARTRPTDRTSDAAKVTRAPVRLDGRTSSGEMPLCVSAYGVFDLTGNVDEWVINEAGRPHASGLMGGYWGPVRDQCRAMTVAHDEKFAYDQIGFRCCADAPR